MLGELATGDWAPMVFGRTRYLDRWWQAVPANAPAEWLNDVLDAAFGSGPDKGLTAGPRLLLARESDGGRVFVGLLCLADQLTPERGRDVGGRGIPALVGWVSRCGGEQPAAAAVMATQARSWAAPLWEYWMTPSGN